MLQNGTPSPARLQQSGIAGSHPDSRIYFATCQRKIRSLTLLIAAGFANAPQE